LNQETPADARVSRNIPLPVALVVVVGLGLVLFIGKQLAERAVPDVPGVALTDVHSVEDLRSRFNQDQGAPRLVLFLSPT
jgi:hypothetical protein